MPWLLLGAFLISYGLIAFNAGLKITPLSSNDAAHSAATIDSIIEQTEQGVDMVGRPETEVLPFWVNVMARLGSANYAYGPDSIMETERHYHLMGEERRYVLSAHMMLGVIIMVSGFFQFWPGFRRRHRRAHRLTGMLYIVGAVLSMSMSAYFLLRTGVDQTFNGFVFYVGLWYLLILSLLSIGVAMWAVSRRQIAMHLGWQSLAFACFLSAPIQRAIWMSVGSTAGEASFNEVNIAVNVSLFGWCFIAGYAIFYANRESSPQTPANEPYPMEHPGWARWILGAALVSSFALLIKLYTSAHGLSGFVFAQQLSPQGALTWHDSAIEGGWVAALVCSLIVLLASSSRMLLRSPHPQQLSRAAYIALMISGSVVALIYLGWGHALGMPTHERSVAGVFYAAVGLTMLGFITLMLRAAMLGRNDKLREWLWFVVLLAVSPGFMFGQMFLLNSLSISPNGWEHHGYQLAAAVAFSTPIMIGHLLAVHSQSTQRYSVN